MIEQAVEELSPLVGTRSACRALGVARATIYRRRRPAPPPRTRSRPRPARALSPEEQASVLTELRSERFVDASPAQVWATLLDEGRYLCSERTMYRLLAEHREVRERRDQLTHPAYAKPELLAERPNQLWSWTSPSCSARRSGPTTTSTSSWTSSAATSSAGPFSTGNRPRWPSN